MSKKREGYEELGQMTEEAKKLTFIAAVLTAGAIAAWLITAPPDVRDRNRFTPTAPPEEPEPEVRFEDTTTKKRFTRRYSTIYLDRVPDKRRTVTEEPKPKRKVRCKGKT